MKQNLEKLIENFFYKESGVVDIKTIILKEYLQYQKLKEQTDDQKDLLDHITNSVNSLDKEEMNIISVSPSNKTDIGVVIRFENKEDIEKNRSKIKSAVKVGGVNITDELVHKYDSSIEVSSVTSGESKVYIIYKYDIGSREGLALEHVVSFLLTEKVTDQLKDRLNLAPEASKEDVIQKLESDFSDVLQVGLEGKKLIEEKIGKVLSAESVGSVNSKADLILTTESGKKYGLSIKLVTEEGRGVRFTYNKNLGYGDEQDDNLVKNPSGQPWWIVGRKIFAKKLGREYNPDNEDFEAPSWMTKAKENKRDVYKESMEEVYEKIREVYVNNLRNLKFKDLVVIVNEAQQGSKEEKENYEELIVLSSDTDGVRLESSGATVPDIEKIKTSGLTKKDLVKTEGANIIIDIPGLSPLTIHGLKFHSNMLSSKRDDLKIKTR